MLDVEMLLRVAGSYRKTNVCMGVGGGRKQIISMQENLLKIRV